MATNGRGTEASLPSLVVSGRAELLAKHRSQVLRELGQLKPDTWLFIPGDGVGLRTRRICGSGCGNQQCKCEELPLAFWASRDGYMPSLTSQILTVASQTLLALALKGGSQADTQ